MEKPTRYDVHVDSWQERDRLGIWVTDTRTDKTIAEWWDEGAREMFEDGFFKEADYVRDQKLVGRAFEESVLEYLEDMGTLAKESGGVYWWVRLGDVAEYERFDTFEGAKEHVEEATSKPFSEAHWINQYGFQLGPYQALNYISFFEGDEAAQPTEQHLYAKP